MVRQGRAARGVVVYTTRRVVSGGGGTSDKTVRDVVLSLSQTDPLRIWVFWQSPLF